ncbi:hypothetical protein [Roseospira navarrensis]|uniref:HicB-like antitoxin of toxin-antitoxin system domain-containing protein n=1 Tax=Roseospira navarrensis TaxID=140058 RepID=A0A7X1ZB34_9PROT|nr:hypothetical protein [Roseospira navarrensis]MQX35133.1 hypothetical protein [Roseospira navarrensis]
MKGHIVVVSRRSDGYRADVVGVAGCGGDGPTVDDAVNEASKALSALARDGATLPAPRPSIAMLDEVERRDGCAGACLRVA